MKSRKKYKLTSLTSVNIGDIADIADTEYSYIEQDACFVSDDRVWKSNVKDIKGGDNFADYCKDFFEMLDEEEYYDN